MKPAQTLVSLREAARRVRECPRQPRIAILLTREELLASVAAEGFKELAAAMETGATGSDPLGGVGLAYFDFAVQKRGLFRLMLAPFWSSGRKYPDLDEAAGAVFDLI